MKHEELRAVLDTAAASMNRNLGNILTVEVASGVAAVLRQVMLPMVVEEPAKPSAEEKKEPAHVKRHRTVSRPASTD